MSDESPVLSDESPVLTEDERRVLDEVRRRRVHDVLYPWLSAQDLRRLEFFKYYRAHRDCAEQDV